MVFTALDVFTAGLPPLEDGRPEAGSPLFDYIVRRLFDSFNPPGGVARYYSWMLTPDGSGPGRRSPTRRTIVDEWPLIKSDLDSGRPCPLGLVTVRSANPALLGRNHQVLASGYRQIGQRLTIDVYDPNTDPVAADRVWISVNLSEAGSAGAIEHNVAIDGRIRGLFRVRYRAADPRIA
jgi:hypothetical protein